MNYNMDKSITENHFAKIFNSRNAIPMAMNRLFKVFERKQELDKKMEYVPIVDDSCIPKSVTEYPFIEIPIMDDFVKYVLSDASTKSIVKKIDEWNAVNIQRNSVKKELQEVKFQYKKMPPVAAFKKVESQIREFNFLKNMMKSEGRVPYNVIPRTQEERDNLISVWTTHINTQLTFLNIKSRLMGEGLLNIKKVEDVEVDIMALEQRLKELKTKKDNIRKSLRKSINVGERGIQLMTEKGTIKFTMLREV